MLEQADLGGARLFAAKRLHRVHGRGLAGWNITRSHGRRADERSRCNIREWIKGCDAKQQGRDPV